VEKSWLINITGGVVRVVSTNRTTSWESFFSQAFSNPLARRTLVEIYEHLGGTPLGPLQANERSLRQTIEVILREAYNRGQLLLVGQGAAGGMSGSLLEAENAASAARAQQRAAPVSQAAERAEKTWVEVQLLDPNDRPVANERYSLQLPDGSVRTGKLDNEGIVRVRGIDPGTCKISFPDIVSEWGPDS